MILTLASHSCILRMSTVVTSNRVSRTVSQSGFSSSTVNIIQPDRPSPLTKRCTRQSCGSCVYNHTTSSIEKLVHFNLTSCLKSQLPTHYLSIRGPPQIITDSTPYTTITEFHPAFIAVCSTYKSDVSLRTASYQNNERGEINASKVYSNLRI